MNMVIFEPWFVNAVRSIEEKVSEVKLRDLFAIAAMNAVLPTSWGMDTNNENIANFAYEMADEMLKARKRK